MKHTPQELAKEWKIVFETRLGTLCGAAEPTPEQLKIAAGEAKEAVERLKAQELEP